VTDADLDVAYLTTTGRMSGTPHRIEIWFALEGTTAYLLAGGGDRSDWVRNLTISPTVTLQLGSTTRVTQARVVTPGTDEDALARRVVLHKYEGRERSDLSEWARTALPIAVEWPA
jgi:deazaflavin-dependent oxidoreductase (nitroreductase family)